MIDNPLVPNLDAANAAHSEMIQARAAEARSPGEWFDIYCEVVEFNVKTTMEAHGDGALALEKLRERRTHAKVIRAEFERSGLPLSEDIEIEGGPVVHQSPLGLPTRIEWPSGMWIRFILVDGTKIEFRGEKAWTAYTFIRWWDSYHQRFLQLTDPTAAAAASKPKTRIIEPHSPEWLRYMAAKRADQNKGIEP